MVNDKSSSMQDFGHDNNIESKQLRVKRPGSLLEREYHLLLRYSTHNMTCIESSAQVSCRVADQISRQGCRQDKPPQFPDNDGTFDAHLAALSAQVRGRVRHTALKSPYLRPHPNESFQALRIRRVASCETLSCVPRADSSHSLRSCSTSTILWQTGTSKSCDRRHWELTSIEGEVIRRRFAKANADATPRKSSWTKSLSSTKTTGRVRRIRTLASMSSTLNRLLEAQYESTQFGSRINAVQKEIGQKKKARCLPTGQATLNAL